MTDELHQLTRTVLDRGYLLSLGIVDADGPWVADVIYIFDDDFNLYWMSTPHRRHSKAIDGGNNRVAAAIAVTQDPNQPDEGLQISGVAQRLNEPSLELLKSWMKKKNEPVAGGLAAERPLFAPFVHVDGEWEALIGLPKEKTLEMIKKVSTI